MCIHVVAFIWLHKGSYGGIQTQGCYYQLDNNHVHDSCSNKCLLAKTRSKVFKEHCVARMTLTHEMMYTLQSRKL